MTRTTSREAVVIGGGQAGLTLSFYLQKGGIKHVVFERDQAFSAWRDRWVGFRANTPNWMNTLPMVEPSQVPGGNRGGFATREELLDYFEKCLLAYAPPLQIGVDVESVTQRDDGLWEVTMPDAVVETPNVAVCVGAMSSPRIPSEAAELAGSIPQLHSAEYRNPDQIGTESVLVVGSGSSGIQITELLCKSGRFQDVHLAISNVLVLPERILGIPIHRVVHFFGLFDVRISSLLGRLMFSNLETRGDPIVRPTPKDLARLYNVALHERFAGATSDTVRFADGETLSTEGLTVLWCTGFHSEFSFVKPADRIAAFDAAGNPIHSRGAVTAAPGLYFVGLRYQHTVASHDIYGVGNDARYVADHIARRLGKGLRRSG